MKAINTGLGVTWLKAAGMLYPQEQRLFEDPFAEKLLTPFYKFWILLMHNPKIFKSIMKSKERSVPGITGWMFCRFRYIDDVLKSCITKNEIETVVNLGAGYDCRAYYIPGVESINYFEVDHPSVIKKKKAKMKKILGKLPDHVSFIPVDFEKQSLETELKNAGYDLFTKTLFIWEGVTQYISEQANDIVLKYVTQAASGSKIVFTYILKNFINGKDIRDDLKVMYKYMCKKNNPLWIYGLYQSDLEAYLSKYSLFLIEDVGAEEVEERYMKLVNINLPVSFDIERIALAEVKKQNIV